MSMFSVHLWSYILYMRKPSIPESMHIHAQHTCMHQEFEIVGCFPGETVKVTHIQELRTVRLYAVVGSCRHWNQWSCSLLFTDTDLNLCKLHEQMYTAQFPYTEMCLQEIDWLKRLHLDFSVNSLSMGLLWDALTNPISELVKDLWFTQVSCNSELGKLGPCCFHTKTLKTQSWETLNQVVCDGIWNDFVNCL